MKVKIQYTIDLEKIPDQIKRFLYSSEALSRKVSSKLSEIYDNLKLEPNEQQSASKQLEKIEEVRQCLSTIDYSLQDVSRILVDYEELKLAKSKQKLRQSTVDVAFDKKQKEWQEFQDLYEGFPEVEEEDQITKEQSGLI